MDGSKPLNVAKLIAVPAVITLCVTLLRLVGELQHWPMPWVNNAAGGQGALIGISWLPIIFGPYFAVKLVRSGNGPLSSGKTIGFAFASVIVLFFAGYWFQTMISHPTAVALLPLAMMLGAAFIPGIAWRTFGKTLLAYAFAARIPVLVVMYVAMSGNGGKGWGTHYDAIAPMFLPLSFARKYIYEALLPQMTLWIGWTVAVGALFGTVTAAIARKIKS